MKTLSRRIYVASSWRNSMFPATVAELRKAGHEVYDFRNPAPGNEGLAWSEIDREWLGWDPNTFVELLHSSPIAAKGFALDKAALDWCDTCVLVLPCGRSAHLEAGYVAGQGKDVYFLLHEEKFEPELMYLLGTRCSCSLAQIIEWMAANPPADVSRWHELNGGHFANPMSHALRLLHEVVELCIASGALVPDIYQVLMKEIRKAEERAEFGGDPKALPGEVADCGLLLDVFAKYAGIDQNAEKRKKIAVLWERQWAANNGGALYRPMPPVIQERSAAT